jgi:drug/metabolite transporter (DMT)-like permease
LYGGVILSLRRLREHEPAFLVALNHVGTSVLLFPVAWGSGYWPHGVQWLYLAAFGMLQLGLPYMFLARGLRTVPSHQASLLTLVEPLLVPVWVYLAWGRHPSYQPPSVWTVAGGLLIISGLLYRHVFRDGLRSGNNVNSRAPQKTSTA